MRLLLADAVLDALGDHTRRSILEKLVSVPLRWECWLTSCRYRVRLSRSTYGCLRRPGWSSNRSPAPVVLYRINRSGLMIVRDYLD